MDTVNPLGRPKRASLLHGTVASYKAPKQPCRCAACREAWRVYKKLYRRRRIWDASEQAVLLDRMGKYTEAQQALIDARNKS